MKKTFGFTSIVLFLITVSVIPVTNAYENLEYDFSITPPSGWSVDEVGEDIVVEFVNYDSFSYIMVGQEMTNLNLSEYVTYGTSDNEQWYTNYFLVSERSRVINGLNCYEIVFTLTDDLEFQLKQVFFVKNDRAYIISCTALKSEYATDNVAFEQSIQSFQLISNIDQTPTEPLSPNPSPEPIPPEPPEPELTTPKPTTPEQAENTTETALISTELVIIATVAVACVVGILAIWVLRKRNNRSNIDGYKV